ncbi:MAG: family 78 glycoside hydrolase catalytic domain [Saprospiraceae bacterium]|nr:family 78 glycoside hydrolase catalytic domain [Saprospiraceae bacterium]
MNKSNHALFFLVATLLLSVLSCNTNDKIQAPSSLTVCEGFTNPIGFYDSHPTFSWQLPQAVQSQSAYALVAASSPELLPNKPDLWQSGKVRSDQSLYVKYKGEDLSSRQEVFWQVKVWDNQGNESKWSRKAFFELGLLHNNDWKAKWINLPDEKAVQVPEINKKVHRVQYLRKDIILDENVEKARLYITAKGLFQAHINGTQVGHDALTPGWTPYQKRIETLTYDVEALLKNGENTIGIELAEGWYSGRLIFRGYAEVDPQVIAQLEVEYKNGDHETFITDHLWSGTVEGPIRYSSIYDGESYDANFDMPAWSTNSFDDTEWTDVAAQSISENVALTPKRHHPVRAKLSLSTQTISKPAKGNVVFDLGQNMAGIPKINIPVKKGQKVRIRFAEMLQPNGEIYTRNYRSAVSTDFYMPVKDSVIEWQPKFTFHGFRYVELSGFDESFAPEKTWVTGLVQYSDFHMAGTFSSSHEKLNQLQSNIEWGLRGNFLDIPTDCPQRDERAGWTGDAQVFIPTSLFIADSHSFWSSWMQSLREDQRENGSVPIVVPDIDGRRTSAGWGDAATVIPWEIYLRTGDVKILEDSYQSMLEWINYYQSVSEDHIVDLFTYGDWLQPFSEHPTDERKGETDEKLVSTAYNARSVDLSLQAAKILGLSEDVTKLRSRLNEIQIAFQNHFFDAEGRVSKGKPTQTAYLLAIGFNLLSPEMEQKAIPHLIAEIEKAENHLRTGFLGTPLLAPVLEKINRTDLMFEMLYKESYPSWFYSINQGATTMWERWDSYTHEDGFHKGGMNSFNHYAYGAIGQWMYERIAGIKPIKAGYKEILIAPLPDGPLSSAQAKYNCPYGEVSSAWKMEKGVFQLNVTIPPNTTAKIVIPGKTGKNLILNGTSFSENADVKLLKKAMDTFELTVLPGSYEFKSFLTQKE